MEILALTLTSREHPLEVTCRTRPLGIMYEPIVFIHRIDIVNFAKNLTLFITHHMLETLLNIYKKYKS